MEQINSIINLMKAFRSRRTIDFLLLLFCCSFLEPHMSLQLQWCGVPKRVLSLGHAALGGFPFLFHTGFGMEAGCLEMRVRFAVTLALAGFLSWLAAFAFDCYYREPNRPGESHPRGQQPPFPSGAQDNLFWFLQVHQYGCQNLPPPKW